MKKTIFIFLSIIIGLLIGLVFLELFLRFNHRLGYNFSSFENKSHEHGLLRNIRPSALLGYEYDPSCATDDINAYGLIGKAYPLEKSDGIYRILILGDSIAAKGLASKFLEDRLNNSRELGLKRRFEVWTLGVPSYDVRRYYLFLKNKGLGYSPDMVVIFMCINDFSLNLNVYYKNSEGITEYYFPIRAISRVYTDDPFFMEHSYLYRFIILRIDSYMLAKGGRDGYNEPEGVGMYYMGKIKELCRERKIPLFVVVFPLLKPFSEYKEWEAECREGIFSVLKKLKIPYVDMYEGLSKEALYNMRVDKRDDMHPGREGHRLVAEAVYDKLLGSIMDPKAGGGDN